MSFNIFDIPFRTRSSESDFLCKDGEISSGTDPLLGDNTEAPTPEISFFLVRDILKGWHNHPDVYPAAILAASEPSMEYWTNLGARLLMSFQAEASEQSLFVTPFFVTAAWKTVTGIYLKPSPPQIMIPNSKAPLVTTAEEINKQEPEFRVAGAVCSLCMKMKAPEVLRDWVGKIASLEILVSDSLHTYDTLRTFMPRRRVTTDAWCRSLDPITGETADRRICTDTLPLAWTTATTGEIIQTTATSAETLRNLHFHPFFSVPLSEADRLESLTKCTPDSDIGFRLIPTEGDLTYAQILNSSKPAQISRPVIIEGNGGEIDITTRPLKFSGAGTLKKVRRIYLRGDYEPERLTISVYASRDMLKWWRVSVRSGGTVAALPPTPFRFYKLRIEGVLAEGFNLQGFTVETD